MGVLMDGKRISAYSFVQVLSMHLTESQNG